MCGRYVRSSDKQRIAEHFRLTDPAAEVFPSYNIAPTSFQPIIRLDDDSGERSLVTMRWGLVPAWVRDAKRMGISTINTKAETILEKPAWRVPFQKRRCLVPADGFYEWQKIDSGGKNKQPFAFGMADGSTFAFAGLWDRRRAEDGLNLESYSIITTEANELMAAVHTRMPVILKPSEYARWLAPDAGLPPPIDLLRPFDADRMKSWKVDPAVGNARNDRPELFLKWTAEERKPDGSTPSQLHEDELPLFSSRNSL